MKGYDFYFVPVDGFPGHVLSVLALTEGNAKRKIERLWCCRLAWSSLPTTSQVDYTEIAFRGGAAIKFRHTPTGGVA